VSDKDAAVRLLAWMMSPEVLAEVAYTSGCLPSSRAAAQDPRFANMSELAVFLDLIADANAAPSVPTPFGPERNQALRQVEEEVLRNGGDPEPLLAAVQAGFAFKLVDADGDE
jgi:ABC-type glycerol-3-phosphate transport system substrate-binding protein